MIEPNLILSYSLNPKYKSGVTSTEDTDFLVGRETDSNKLENILTQRKSATVLISGVRGVGKTSFVRAVIKRIEKENDLLPVFISFAEVHNDADRKMILGALIRSLYVATERSGVDIDDESLALLQSLYEQVTYSNIEESSKIDLLKQKSSETLVREQTTITQKFEISDQVKKLLLTLLFTPLVLHVSNLPIGPWWKLTIYIALLFAAIYFVFFQSENNSKENDNETKRSHNEEAATGLQVNKVLDNTFETLEAKFENVLEKLSLKNKIVFILDELDKLDEEKVPASDSKITSIIKPLKNLLTLSPANFVFITNQEFYDSLSDESEHYSSTSTLFTDKIFLPAHTTKDIYQIIDAHKSSDGSGSEFYEVFKSYLSYISKNHIFSLQKALDAHLFYESSEKIEVRVLKDGDERGNIPEDWKIMSTLAVYLDVTYNFYKKPNDPRYNQKLYESLHAISGQFLGPNYSAAAKGDNWLAGGDFTSGESDEQFIIDLNGATEFMFKLMDRHGFCKSHKEVIDVGGKDVFETTFDLEDETYPRIDELSVLDEVLSYEYHFIQLTGELVEKFNLIKKSIVSEMADSLEKEVESLQKFCKKVETHSKIRVSKSEILKRQEELELLLGQIEETFKSSVTIKLSKDLNMSKSVVERSHTGQFWAQHDPSLTDFYSQLKQDLNQTPVLFHPNKHRGVIVLWNATENHLNAFKEIKESERAEAKNRVISINPVDINDRAKYWTNFEGVTYENIDSEYERIKQKITEYAGLEN